MLQFENGTTAIAWEHSFQMASDGMAVDYGRKVAENDPAAKQARAILVWTTEPDAEDALLARFERLPVQVIDTHSRQRALAS
jgi:hypothetical protein